MAVIAHVADWHHGIPRGGRMTLKDWRDWHARQHKQGFPDHVHTREDEPDGERPILTRATKLESNPTFFERPDETI